MLGKKQIFVTDDGGELVFSCQFSVVRRRRRVSLSYELTPLFFISVASKGLRVCVNALESTLVGTCISVDSKRVTRWSSLSVGRKAAASRRTPRTEIAKQYYTQWLTMSQGDCGQG
jgi:hypothetical protein